MDGAASSRIEPQGKPKAIAVLGGGGKGAIAPQVFKLWAKFKFFGQ